ncbi:MAG: ABC transporter substrate-binding protein, partial [Chloroflexota bacterium]|nr:ABC transporter substrate-binding protein [Chloroflexota bacterium]
QMAAQGIRIVRPPIYSGPALFINYAVLGDAFSDKRVRQAIAHALDRSQNGIVSLADSGIGVQYMTGMSDNLLPSWVEPSAMEQFNQYEFNRDRATELLTEVGWTQDGEGRWVLPDGTPTSFELIFPAEFADWSASGQDFANQLTDFGIEIVPRAVTFTQQAEDVLNGRFQLAIRGWGSSTNPHPHFSYTANLFTNNKVGSQDATVGMSYPLVQETEVVGQVDLQQLTLDAAAGLDQTQQVETLTTLALAFNELLPIVPFFERYGNNPALEGVRVESWPADDDPIYQNSPYADGIPDILMLTGVLQPV